MQLEKPWLNSNGHTKRKPNKLQQKALNEHERWLEKRGLTSKQISKKRNTERSKTRITEISEYSRRPKFETSNQVGNGFVKSIFEEIRNDKKSVQDAVMRKAQRVSSLYHKGPLQLITDGEDITMIGSKSRRG